MNHRIIQSELFLQLSNPARNEITKQVLEALQDAFYTSLCDQVESSDFAYAHRLLSIVEGKFRTLKEELAQPSFKSEKKHSNPYLHH